jgi:serine/threonine protein kinase
MNKRLQIGEKVGEYEIVGFLGAGGMGSVYHGIHKKINRSAAIKVLSETATSSNFKERFFNEAQLQSSLHHPNIATLYDFQESGDVLFIVMEYVDGETLDALVSRRFFAVEDALATFESVCDAVGFIHSNNIVHRDIKPQNIKLSSSGKVKLLDFGIAKGEVSHGLTRVGGVIGTPNYLAPEQLLGQPASPRSDIWALGVLLYEMLTGATPFKGRTLGELHVQITTSKYEPPELSNPAVSPAVSRIVSRCLTVDPGQRYQSIDEVLADVKEARKRYSPQPGNDAGKAASPMGPLFRLANRVSITGGTPVSNSDAGTVPTRSFGPGLAVAAAAFVLFVGLVGIVVWATSGPSSVAANGERPSQPLKTPVAGEKKDLAGAVKPSRHMGTDVIAERPRLRIESTEGTAEVYRDGVLIGSTPLQIEGDENEMVELTFKRAGYEDKAERIEITTRRKVFTVALKRKQ